MKEQILEKLKSVKYPGFDKDIVSFNFVKDIKTENENVIVELEIVSSNPQVSEELRKNIDEALASLNLKNLQIHIITPKIPEEKSNSRSGKNIAPQGKSTTTVNLAISMAKMGKRRCKW